MRNGVDDADSGLTEFGNRTSGIFPADLAVGDLITSG
jgi:hypothetical protein